jgi:hypothetical protein
VEEAGGSLSRYLEPVAENETYEIHFQAVWSLWPTNLKMQLLMLILELFEACGR